MNALKRGKLVASSFNKYYVLGNIIPRGLLIALLVSVPFILYFKSDTHKASEAKRLAQIKYHQHLTYLVADAPAPELLYDLTHNAAVVATNHNGESIEKTDWKHFINYEQPEWVQGSIENHDFSKTESRRMKSIITRIYLTREAAAKKAATLLADMATKAARNSSITADMGAQIGSVCHEAGAQEVIRNMLGMYQIITNDDGSQNDANKEKFTQLCTAYAQQLLDTNEDGIFSYEDIGKKRMKVAQSITFIRGQDGALHNISMPVPEGKTKIDVFLLRAIMLVHSVTFEEAVYIATTLDINSDTRLADTDNASPDGQLDAHDLSGSAALVQFFKNKYGERLKQHKLAVVDTLSYFAAVCHQFFGNVQGAFLRSPHSSPFSFDLASARLHTKPDADVPTKPNTSLAPSATALDAACVPDARQAIFPLLMLGGAAMIADMVIPGGSNSSAAVSRFERYYAQLSEDKNPVMVFHYKANNGMDVFFLDASGTSKQNYVVDVTGRGSHEREDEATRKSTSRRVPTGRRNMDGNNRVVVFDPSSSVAVLIDGSGHDARVVKKVALDTSGNVIMKQDNPANAVQLREKYLPVVAQLKGGMLGAADSIVKGLRRWSSTGQAERTRSWHEDIGQYLPDAFHWTKTIGSESPLPTSAPRDL